MQDWFAVYTKPRQEEIARENLERQSFRTYLPRLKHTKRSRGRWIEAIDPLFPRYLFIALDLGAVDISPIRSTLGTVGLVRFGLTPAVAPSGFVESLIAAEDPDLGCHLHDTEPFKKGDTVDIVSGPFAGTRAIFEEPTPKGRVALLLGLLGRTNRVQVDRNQIVRAS